MNLAPGLRNDHRGGVLVVDSKVFFRELLGLLCEAAGNHSPGRVQLGEGLG